MDDIRTFVPSVKLETGTTDCSFSLRSLRITIQLEHIHAHISYQYLQLRLLIPLFFVSIIRFTIFSFPSVLRIWAETSTQAFPGGMHRLTRFFHFEFCLFFTITALLFGYLLALYDLLRLETLACGSTFRSKSVFCYGRLTIPHSGGIQA